MFETLLAEEQPDFPPGAVFGLVNLPVDDEGEPFFPRDDSPDAIPPDLDSLAPGPVLAAIVSAVDPARVSGHDQVTLLRAFRRLVSHFQARMYETMAAIHDTYLSERAEDDPDRLQWGWEGAATEIEAGLRLTRRCAEGELSLAETLHRRLPRLGEALRAGRIDARKAWVIDQETCHLAEDTARRVVDQVIERAEGLTTGQLGHRLRRLAIEMNPEDARTRYDDRLTGRRVVTETTTAGTVNLLGLDLPAARVAQARARINSIARRLKTRTETRTMDQLRADVFLDLLAGKHAEVRAGALNLTVDLTTLAELTENPGELAGMGPVIADIARQAAPQIRSWTWTVTHPDSGQPIATGVTRRRPDAATRRRVQAAFQTCVSPGCRMPAAECDLDHRIPYSDGGPTQDRNLAPACRHHHRIRHRHDWTYRRLPNGDHLWVSPLGHRYTTSGLPP